MQTTTTLELHTLDQIKRAAERAGSHWFDRSTLRYFNSRISEHVYPVPNGALFVSSEKFTGYREPDGERLYTVRSCTYDGSINTVGEFQQYRTSKAAHAAALRLMLDGFSLTVNNC
jgi:hypothetical protein